MKTFKRLTTFVVSLLLIVAFSSCEKQSDDLQSISFNVQNVTNSLKKATGPKDIDTPVCKDDTPAYVLVEIDNVVFRLDILSGLNDGTETQVLKLDVGTYTLQSFKVYSNLDSLMWATPNKGSYYANLFGINGVDTTFTVEAFKKSKFDIDVLCWQAYSYKDFGFNWFDYNEIEVKTLCFFGDVCVEDFDLWHETGLYYNQPYDGFDFPALFEVIITNEAGDVVNDLTVNANIEHPDGTPWMGIGSPLCIEYPNYIGVVDNYKFSINLFLPNGDLFPVIVDQAFTAEEDQENITGDDGIFDFVVGSLCDGDTPPPGGEEPPPSGCETAFAKFSNVDNSYETGYVFTNKAKDNPESYLNLDIAKRWGWAVNIKRDGTYTYDIWAAAGKNDTSKGTLVGDFEIVRTGKSVKITYTMDSGYTMDELHIYAMDTPPTSTANGKYKYGDSATKGVFESLSNGDETNFILEFEVTDYDSDGIWFIAHAVVCSPSF